MKLTLEQAYQMLWAMEHIHTCPCTGSGEYPTDYRCQGCRKVRYLMKLYGDMLNELEEPDVPAPHAPFS